MKKSNYNFFWEYPEDDEKSIAYNSRTNALAMIDKKDYMKYENYINNSDNSFKVNNKKIFDDLKKGGFLIDEEIDELQLLRHNLLNERYSSRSLGITIAPTLNCNFACIYCYEKGKNEGYMSKDVQKEIIKFVEQQAKYIDSISITWYGGEPLLALDVIEYITNEILEICNKESISYMGGIVTNGYNLTKDVLLKFKELKIYNIQVTIDGPEDIHDKMRPLKNGGKTFSKIMQNLSENKDLLPQTSLRINIDKNNHKELKSILGVIKDFDISDRVSIYPGYIEPTNDCYSINRCLSFSDFARVEYDFINTLVQEGYISDTFIKYPFLKSNVCTADKQNSLVIDPCGNAYKCWSDIGRDEYKITNLLDNEPTNINKFMEYLLYDPTEDLECYKCKVLPICMGGCPRRRIDKIVDRCSSYKYVLEDYLKKIANEEFIKVNSNSKSVHS